MKLHVPHVCVDAIESEQLIVRTLLSRHAIFQHDDVVGIADGSKSMSNHQDRSVRTEAIESVLNALFSDSVKRRRCFVEQDKRGIFQEAACNGQALTLSTRQLYGSNRQRGLTVRSRIAKRPRVYTPDATRTFSPRSPTMVSQPSSNPSMNSSSCESLAALSNSSCVAEGFPYFKLYLIDSLNMLAAWGTTPIAPRSDC